MEQFVTPEMVNALLGLVGAVISGVAVWAGAGVKKYFGTRGDLITQELFDIGNARLERVIENAAVRRGWIEEKQLTDSQVNEIAKEALEQIPDTVSALRIDGKQIAKAVPGILKSRAASAAVNAILKI